MALQAGTHLSTQSFDIVQNLVVVLQHVTKVLHRQF
jgi:hypothetical protein